MCPGRNSHSYRFECDVCTLLAVESGGIPVLSARFSKSTASTVTRKKLQSSYQISITVGVASDREMDKSCTAADGFRRRTWTHKLRNITSPSACFTRCRPLGQHRARFPFLIHLDLLDWQASENWRFGSNVLRFAKQQIVLSERIVHV